MAARTPLSQYIAEGEAHPLPKVLGPVSITFMGIGAIIGAGIFVLTGTAAALFAGPAIIISFVLAAIACGFVGLCYMALALAIGLTAGRVERRVAVRR